jgi:YidC/Oxa1 family membrane protein insertase
MLVTANIFQPLIDIFEAVLKFFHNSIGVPWGWSIVLLTVAVRACLIPLTIKQFSSMARMQSLQPEMKEIQKKYKDDKQRQQQEVMKFYKENKVNPLGSCLPMVAQLPVFISLYYMLRQSLRGDICPGLQPKLASGAVNLAKVKACGPNHGAGFLFISDITNKAAGATLVVLIILYVGTQLSSSLMMSGATMDPTQRKIMLFMPLLFVLFVIRFPAGVLVYWITTNTWTMGQQYIVRRRIGPLRAAAATAAEARATSAVPSSRSSNGAGAKSLANGSGSGSGGGLAGLIRSKIRPEEQKTPVATGGRGGPPPKSPRKKKKRSGRRR